MQEWEPTRADIAHVRNMARKVTRTTGAFHLRDELESAGYVGLVMAHRRHDPELGDWEPFSLYIMRNHMYDFLRTWWGRTSPKPESGGLLASSLDDPDNTSVVVDRGESPEAAAVARDEVRAALRLVHRETPKVADAILGAARGETLREVGERHGVTESRMCQIRTVAQARLRRERDRADAMAA